MTNGLARGPDQKDASAMPHETYSAAELSRFRHVQRIAYDVAERVGAELFEGMTEKQAARAMGEGLERLGVKDWFHAPFAWFGDRTSFTGFRTPFAFFPTGRKLAPGMAVILDVAPVVDGYAADIGYTTSFGHCDVVERAKRDLEVFRTRILELVRAGHSRGAIYRAVDELLADLGYENCHQRYPFSTLGHKIGRMPLRRLPLRPVLAFDPRTALYLARQLGEAQLSRLRDANPFPHGPILNGKNETPIDQGLWAIEPHIGREGVGAKWEEILVVTDSDARWLDDDLPHVKGWKKMAA